MGMYIERDDNFMWTRRKRGGGMCIDEWLMFLEKLVSTHSGPLHLQLEY